jgi:hypothetical protein
MSRCKGCLSDRDASAARALLRDESEAHLSCESKRQTWNGTEPALQGLLLPLCTPDALPSYASRPEYLAPDHCRLCFQACAHDPEEASEAATQPVEAMWEMNTNGFHDDTEPQALNVTEEMEQGASAAELLPRATPCVATSAVLEHGVRPAIAAHVKSAHGLEPEEYRHEILRRVIAEWPTPTSPQTLRTRLAAYKETLCDANYLMGVCACCAREKRRCKLRRVEFPPPDVDEAPSWLPWTHDEWAQHRTDWYDQLHNLFDVETYLQHYFFADERVSSAASELTTVRSKSADACAGDIEGVAVLWLQRVEAWRANLRRDLRADSTPAPGDPEARWLLYIGEKASSSLDAPPRSTITCDLCRKCREPLTTLCGGHGVESRTPKLKMPALARANGLWRGSDPAELSALTYAEQKVIQMARLYVSVKRVFLNAGSYASCKRDEAPRCHERNVVAFPQSPDGVFRFLGLLPADLGRTLLVQFVGEDRSRLRHEPTLSVDVMRLRSAFVWLLSNSWLWMQATKNVTHAPQDSLGEHLEQLLAAYATSIGHDGVGVPAELIQGATRIAEAHAPIQQKGPADAVASDDENDATEHVNAVPDDCAAVLQGNTSSLSPLQIWDSVMKQYQVLRRCDEDVARAGKSPEQHVAATLGADYAEAVHAAVHALTQLTHKDIKERLVEFHRLDQSKQTPLQIKHTSEFLSNFDPDFWPSCFVHLFPRGDCLERALRPRATWIPDFRWAKCLITRADFRGWRMDV